MSWSNLFRTVFVLLMAGHVVLMYSLARTLRPTFGFDEATVGLSTLFALLMLLPLAPAIWLSDLPEAYRRAALRRRWKKGLCPACRYPVFAAGGDICQECGTPMREPAPYRFTWGVARRFAVFALVAWIGGSLSSEAWLLSDEAAFRRDASMKAAQGSDSFVRQRRWPGNGYLAWHVDRGYYAARGGIFSVRQSPGTGASKPSDC